MLWKRKKKKPAKAPSPAAAVAPQAGDAALAPAPTSPMPGDPVDANASTGAATGGADANSSAPAAAGEPVSALLAVERTLAARPPGSAPAAGPVATASAAGAGSPGPGAKKKRRKEKRDSRRGTGGLGTLIAMAVILFVVVIALMLWVQSLFNGLNARLIETSRQVEMVSAARATSSASAPATTSAKGGSAKSSASQGGTQDAGSSAQTAQTTIVGRIVSVTRKGSFWDVAGDPAQLLSGKAAVSIAAHQGKVPTNGQFIDDLTHQTRVISCSDGAPVTAVAPAGGGAVPATAKELFAALGLPSGATWRATYFHITIDSDYIVGFNQVQLGQ